MKKLNVKGKLKFINVYGNGKDCYLTLETDKMKVEIPLRDMNVNIISYSKLKTEIWSDSDDDLGITYTPLEDSLVEVKIDFWEEEEDWEDYKKELEKYNQVSFQHMIERINIKIKPLTFKEKENYGRK